MRIKIFLLYYTISFLLISKIIAQPLIIIQSKKQYKAEIKANKGNALMDLKSLLPGIVIDLKYASRNNFTNTNLYKKATTTYLRFAAATALQKVVADLSLQGYNIKIFDAYRPYSATKLMWELIKDERYVANPKNGSNHNRGLAIDLTLIDKNGKEINMGTGFDNFTDTAHHSFINLNQEIRNNRNVLKRTMEKNGFKALETEWWHYSFITGETTSVIDLNFYQLRKWIK